MPVLDLPNAYYDLPPGKLANVVTCLEMRSLPERRLVPIPQNAALEKIDPVDLAAYRRLFQKIGQDLMWFSRLIMPDEKLAGILANPRVQSFALHQDREAIGILELDFGAPGDCELAFFGLAPSAIGKGLGRALMDEAIRRAWNEPITRFWVHTCTFDSPKALPFYIRSGFTPYARMVEIHDDPRLQGKLPETASPQVPLLR